MQRHFQTQAKGANKRQRTRGSLLDAAIDVMAKQGISNAKISDITQHAGLADGTFYNHFKDKESLVTETAVAIAMELAQQLDLAMHQIDDALSRVTVASSLFVQLAVQYQQWGQVLLESYYTFGAIRRKGPIYLQKDIALGIEQKQFNVELDAFLLEQVVALLMACLRHQLEQGFDQQKNQRMCEHILRMLGVSSTLAAESVRAAQVWIQPKRE